MQDARCEMELTELKQQIARLEEEKIGYIERAEDNLKKNAIISRELDESREKVKDLRGELYTAWSLIEELTKTIRYLKEGPNQPNFKPRMRSSLTKIVQILRGMPQESCETGDRLTSFARILEESEQETETSAQSLHPRKMSSERSSNKRRLQRMSQLLEECSSKKSENESEREFYSPPSSLPISKNPSTYNSLEEIEFSSAAQSPLGGGEGSAADDHEEGSLRSS